MPKLSVQLRIKPCPSPFVTINENFISIDNKKYEFNHIYDENSTFYKIYQNSLVNMLDSFFSKYNCCIICYGQTGSGKTYTMGLCIDRLGVYEEYLRKENGDEKMLNVHKNNNDIENENMDIENDNIENINVNTTYTNNIHAYNTHAIGLNDKDNIDYFGIVPDSIEYIFTKTSSISLTFIEIYNEEVIDLLTDYRTPINLRQSKSELSIISTCITCTSKLHTIQILREGLKNRIVRSTKMNLNSSRSHAILTLIMNDTKFTFVDLAGSERLKKLDASRIKETISINSGLLALSNVITALAKKSGYVPYRDSKLTRVLKSNLVNCNTLIMACIASDKQNLSESLNTLKYAHRAMNIDAVVKKNVDSGNKILVELKNENLRLKYENERLKQLLKLGCNKVIVDENDRLKNENEDLKKRVRDLEILRISYEELKGIHEKMVVDMKRANREKRSSLNLGSLRNSLEIEDTKLKRKSIDNYENRVKRNSIEIQRKRSSIEAQENQEAQNKRNKFEMQAKYNDIETTNDNKEVEKNRSSNETHFYGIGSPKKAALENESKILEHSRNRYYDDLNETKKIRSINECENIKNIQTNNNVQKSDNKSINNASKPFFNDDLMDHEIVNPFIDNLSIKEKNEDSYLTDEINSELECKIPATPMKFSKNDVSLHKPVKRRGVTFDLSKTEIKYLEVKKKKFSDILMFSRRKPSINTPGTEIQNVSDSNKNYNIESILLDEPFLTALCIHDNFIFCSTLSGTLYRIQKDTKKVEKLFKENSKIKNLLIYNDLLFYTTENKVKSCIVREVGGVSHYAIHDYIKVSTEISRIALKKDFLCIGTETGYIYVYDLRNKEICLTSDQTHNEGIKTILNTNEMLYIGSTDIFVFNNHYSSRIDIQTSKMFLFDGKIISLHTYSIAVIENGKIENVFETLNYNMTGCALANSFVIGSKNGTVSEYVFKDGIKLVNEFNVDSCIVDIAYDRNIDTIYVITMKREIFVVKLDNRRHLTV